MTKDTTVMVINRWSDNSIAEKAQFDCMLMPAHGVWYHVRLDILFIVTKDLNPNS